MTIPFDRTARLEQAEAENEIMRRKLEQYRLRLEKAILAGTRAEQAVAAKEVWLSIKNLLPCVPALAANRIRTEK